MRVAGPFTVESLSPHRVLPLGEDPYLAELLEAEGEDDSPIRGVADTFARKGRRKRGGTFSGRGGRKFGLRAGGL